MDDSMDYLVLAELAAEDGDVGGSMLRPKPGCTYRAYRQSCILHPVILQHGVALHLSFCSVFGGWLWNGRILNVPDRDLGRFSRVGFVRVPVILLHQGASHD